MLRIVRRAASVLAGVLLVAAGLTVNAMAAPAADPGPAPADSALVPAFESLTRSTTWTLSKTIPLSFDVFEPEGMAVVGNRIYMTTHDQGTTGYFVVMDQNGSLLKEIPLVDGNRNHPGGMDVYGNYAYVPLAVDSPHSSADILQINLTTYQVTTLFTVTYDHVGGIIYDPIGDEIIGQDWGSRVFYTWKMDGTLVAKWKNPQNYIDYQDCKYVPQNKMLCSGIASIGGEDLIDLTGNQHTILNEIPSTFKTTTGLNLTQNPTTMTTTPVSGGTQITWYGAPDNHAGTIYEYTTTIPSSCMAAPINCAP